MIYKNKYYILCGYNIAVQVTKSEHERLRLLLKEPLVNGPENITYIDDETIQEEVNEYILSR